MLNTALSRNNVKYAKTYAGFLLVRNLYTNDWEFLTEYENYVITGYLISNKVIFIKCN